MKITIEAVKVMQVGSGSLWIKNELYLNGSFEGILGIDKPLFDIWGDPVNVSSRLQTSCPTNCAQMSLSTYQALPEGMFEITENPGVFLKGKGVTTTYILKLNERNLGTNTCLYK